jgi:membrane associated rhomboid family serine protease
MEKSVVRIRSTLLSGKPKEESVPVSILITMILAFVSVLCWRDPRRFQLLAASPHQVFAGLEYWRLLTTIAVHADLSHLAVNAGFVVFFGYLLYGYFGFWIYPVAMLILASLTTLLSLLTYPPQVVLIGASGLVYLMVSFWLVMYSLIERTVPPKKRVLRIIGIALIVLVPTTVRPEVSYRTHVIASGAGIIAAFAYFRAGRKQFRSHEVIELETLDDPE